jgi:hypothetical protein
VRKNVLTKLKYWKEPDPEKKNYGMPTSPAAAAEYQVMICPPGK